MYDKQCNKALTRNFYLNSFMVWYFSKHSPMWSAGSFGQFLQYVEASFLPPGPFLSLHTLQSLVFLPSNLYIKWGFPFNLTSVELSKDDGLPRFLLFLFLTSPTSWRTRFFLNTLCLIGFSVSKLYNIYAFTTDVSSSQKKSLRHHFKDFLVKP